MKKMKWSEPLTRKGMCLVGLLVIGLPASSLAFQDCPSELNRPSVLKEAIKCLVENQKELHEAIGSDSARSAASGVSASDLAFVPGKYTLPDDNRVFLVRGPLPVSVPDRELWLIQTEDNSFLARWYTGGLEKDHPAFSPVDSYLGDYKRNFPGESFGKIEIGSRINGVNWNPNRNFSVMQLGKQLNLTLLHTGKLFQKIILTLIE